MDKGVNNRQNLVVKYLYSPLPTKPNAGGKQFGVLNIKTERKMRGFTMRFAFIAKDEKNVFFLT